MDILFSYNQKRKSSLKIPLLHHAASFNNEAEGGCMVKEWDFEAGKRLKDCLIANIGPFSM